MMRKKLPIKKTDEMLTRLFYKLLPVQILIVAVAAINSIVDGTVAGRCIDSSTVGVVGLYFSFVNVLVAIGNMLLGGTAVLCGKAMGKGDIDKTGRIFSLNITVTLTIATALTLLSFVAAGPMADILGANSELKEPLMAYIRGFGVGIIPLLMSQQIASFLQMERQNMRGTIGIASMAIANVVLDILLVAVLKWGVWGLALATALSNWIYFAILASYYLSGKGQLKYKFNSIDWSDTWTIVKIGFPGALLVFCLALRGIVINRVLLTFEGTDGLSAQAAFNMVSGIFIAVAIGTGAALRVLASVFFGEGDRDSLKKLLRIALTRILPQSLAVTALVIVLSKPMSSLFFPDSGSHVFELTRQLFIIYAFCIPLIVLCQIITNYLQAGGHSVYVNILSIFDGFFAMVIPALIFAPFIGALGVWIANPIGILMTLLLSLCYTLFLLKRFPKTDDEWMLFKPEFGIADENRLDITINSVEDVVQTAEKVQDFCEKHGMDRKHASYAALCLEEMAANVVEHGFNKDKKKHSINARVVDQDGKIMLRLKDDCRPFDPKERADMLSDEDPTKNIGLRMVLALSDDMSYYNMMGLNVLTINM